MKLIKKKNEFALNIFLIEENKYIGFIFGGNGDLYWSIHNKKKDDTFFVVTKENYDLYCLFEQLYFDIENINIFEENIPFYIEDENEKIKYIEDKKKEFEKEKARYRIHNKSNYNELFNNDNKTITWYSDETSHKVANVLKIIKKEECFKIEFSTQPYIEGYDRDFNSSNYIPIRFRNSGSSYDPFNILFMKMYNKLQLIDDVNDFGHQIHIEEYLYNKNKVKKLMK